MFKGLKKSNSYFTILLITYFLFLSASQPVFSLTQTNSDNPIIVDVPSRVNGNEMFPINLKIAPEIAQYVNYIKTNGLSLNLNGNVDDGACIDRLSNVFYDGSPDFTIHAQNLLNSWPSDSNINKEITHNLVLFRKTTPEESEDVLEKMKQEGRGLIELYTPANNPAGVTFNYPFQCIVNGDFFYNEFPIAEIHFTQIMVPKKLDMDLPRDSEIKSAFEERNSFEAQAGNIFSFSSTEGITSGKPPYYDILVASSNFDYQEDLVNKPILNYEDFKSIYKDEIKGKSYDAEIHDLPLSIVNALGGDLGFYSYSMNTYTYEKGKQTYFNIDFKASVYNHNSRNGYVILYDYRDVVDSASYSEEDVVNQVLDRLSTIHLSFVSSGKNFGKPKITINDKVLKLLSGKEFEQPVEEEEKENEIVDKKFSISFSNGKGSDTVWNNGRANVKKNSGTILEAIKIKAEAFDKDGKKIKSPDPEKLYSGVYLVGELKTTNSQLGFLVDGSFNNKLKKEVSGDLETLLIQSKGPRTYKGPFKPIEFAEFYLEKNGKKISNKLFLHITVKDGSPSIELRKDLSQVQEGSTKSLEFDFNNPDESENKINTCYVYLPQEFTNVVPGAYLSTSKGEKTTMAKFDCKDGEGYTIIFHAPKIGNFDLNKQLGALSMWKYQENTLMGVATDLVGYGVERRLNSLSEAGKAFQKSYFANKNSYALMKAKQLKEAHKLLNKANTASGYAGKVINAYQTKSNLNGTINSVKDAQETGKSGAGFLEKMSDYGVAGITFTQTVVTAVSVVPESIPVIGPAAAKLGGKFVLVFNLMTNVVKGDLQYLSNVEKINRAKERRIPYPVIIKMTDEDGFEVKELATMMIVYQELD